jgi:NADH-quinone oxidoreductase subunit E
MNDGLQERLDGVLKSFHGDAEELIPILQNVQEEFSYLPPDSMSQIADFIAVPESKVYGVATFYAQFRFTPRGRTHVMVCRGTACHVSGAPRVLEDFEDALGIKEGETSTDLEFSLETVACIGACSLAPCAMINKEVEAKLTKQKITDLFRKGD